MKVSSGKKMHREVRGYFCQGEKCTEDMKHKIPANKVGALGIGYRL